MHTEYTQIVQNMRAAFKAFKKHSGSHEIAVRTLDSARRDLAADGCVAEAMAIDEVLAEVSNNKKAV